MHIYCLIIYKRITYIHKYFVIIYNSFITRGGNMVEVKGINGEEFIINSSLIEIIEFIPETKITMTTGRYYLIKDTKEEIINKIKKYNKEIYRGII